MAQTETQRSWLERLWAGIADRGLAFAGVPAAEVTGPERARQLADTLLSVRGEASAAAVARELVEWLDRLSPDKRLRFMVDISTRYAPDPDRLRQVAEAYLRHPKPESALALHHAAEAPRQELLRRMNTTRRGTATLVALRAELLAHIGAEPALRMLDSDMRSVFEAWFNRGFLELRRIDWETPAATLERLIRYEAVHEIHGWHDLRRRLLPDRRCFGFFHAALPGEPLIFVEVALTEGLAGSIGPLLAPPENEAGGPPTEADTAIFYSISNCQAGLRGIAFGNFLIKQVVEELKAELPSLQHFATLSPVPGFRAWLDGRGPAERPDLEGQWQDDPARCQALRVPLLQLAASYLTTEPLGATAMDPVARFHLGNGAQLERIHFLANPTERGMAESYGIMVNYLYDPERIEANHEMFVRTGRVARSADIDALLTPTRTPEALWRLIGLNS